MDNLKLRIGFVVPNLECGGLENIVAELYLFAVSQGHECTLFVEGSSVLEVPKGVRHSDVVVLNRSEVQFFSELMVREIDILHFNYSIFMLEECTRIGIAVIYVLHNAYIWLSPEEFSHRADVIKFADAVVAVSSFAMKYFLTRASLKELRNKVVVIENGINPAEFRRKSGVTKEAYGISDDEFVFVCVANFNRVKHHLLLIGAAEMILKKNKKFKIMLVGAAGDKLYYSEVRDSVSQSKARDHILFLGHKSRKQVQEIICDIADCAVLPSLIEGCGNFALEAAAAGIPVVMTRTGISTDLSAYTNYIEVVDTAVTPELITLQELDRLSRTTNPPNVAPFARAMLKFMHSKQRDYTHGEFPFSRERMCQLHAELWQEAVQKVFV